VCRNGSCPVQEESATASINSILRLHRRRPYEAACRIADARIDLRRVRHARHQFLTNKLNEEYYESRASTREKTAFIVELLGPSGPDISEAALSKYVTSTPQGSEKFALILLQEAKRLSVFDRYERRVLWRFKFAIREFDAARRQTTT